MLTFDPNCLYCCMSGARIVELLNKSPAILDSLIPALSIPVPPGKIKSLSAEDKERAIEGQVKHLSQLRVSMWYGVDPCEIVAAVMFRSLDKRYVASWFGAVKYAKELAQPLAVWLHDTKGVTVKQRVKVGLAEVDVLGHRTDTKWYGKDRQFVVGVVLTNTVDDFKTAFHQMTTFGVYANEVYLACTPYVAADYLSKHAGEDRWSPSFLNEQAKHAGFGLLLVHGGHVREEIPPQPRSPDERKLHELSALMAGSERAPEPSRQPPVENSQSQAGPVTRIAHARHAQVVEESARDRKRLERLRNEYPRDADRLFQRDFRTTDTEQMVRAAFDETPDVVRQKTQTKLKYGDRVVVVSKDGKFSRWG